MIKNLFKDLFQYLPAQIVPGIVGFISIPILTRLFQPGDYGKYVLVLATINVSVMIVGWLFTSIIRFYPIYERDKKLEEFHSTVLRMSLLSIALLTCVLSSLLLIFKSHISSQLYSLMWIGLPLFILTSSFLVLTEFLRAKRQITLYSTFTVWKSITAIGIGLLFVIFFHSGVDGLLWGSVLSLAIAMPFLWILSVGTIPLCSKKISGRLTSAMARYGFPLVIGNLAAWILSLSDRYVLEFFRNSQEVGIYSASYAISERSIMLIATLFAVTSGSIVFNIWEKEGQEKSKEFLNQITRYYLLICVPATVGLSVLAKPLITILTGQEYHAGYKIIPLVALGTFLLGLQQRFQVGLTFFQKTNFIMLSILISGAFNLYLNFLLIPKYGYLAAATTTLMSYILLLVLMIFVSRRFFVWQFPFKTLLKTSTASTIMGTVVYYVNANIPYSIALRLTVAICAGIIIYFTLIFLFQEIQAQEKTIIKQTAGKFLPKALIPNTWK